MADLGRRDADRERRDDDRNQAPLVFSEYKRLPTNLRGEVTVTNRSTGMILNPVVLEISTDPAYGPGRWVVGRAHSPDREEFLISLPRAIRSGGEVRTEEVRPMERTTALPVYFHTADGPSTLEPEISPVATISFLDQHGREWIRRGADEPQRRIRDR
ncbi:MULTISPECIES: hypothetical protein [Amycolatopsis]|uniref:Uncharacterized protein n=1 Tax=Amycolatopsis albidoflavus TaxID=102226 RepID=A0ABW5HS11_9PSEU